MERYITNRKITIRGEKLHLAMLILSHFAINFVIKSVITARKHKINNLCNNLG